MTMIKLRVGNKCKWCLKAINLRGNKMKDNQVIGEGSGHWTRYHYQLRDEQLQGKKVRGDTKFSLNSRQNRLETNQGLQAIKQSQTSNPNQSQLKS